MKRIAIVMLLAWQGTAWAQTTGSVVGHVRTSDGNPAEYVNISIEGTSKGTVADRRGHFEIRNLTPGHYVVIASYVGLETQRRPVEVNAGETVTVEFILAESAERLQEVVISGGRTNIESAYVAKAPLKNLENPQAYNTVSADLLKEQAITNFDDALKNVPGIHKLWESTGRAYGDGASYYALRGFEAQATMINGLAGLTSGSLDPANIERIEVIKGPSGTLFGGSLISYGGLINTVTKKPYSGFGGEVAYTAGSFGLNRVTADINTPLKDENLLLRVNAAYQTENSFQDAGFRNSLFIAPTLAYKASDRLSFLFVTEFMQEERTNPTMLFLGRSTPLQFSNLEELNYNPKLSLTSNDLSLKNPRYYLQGQVNYKLSDTWTSQTVLSRGLAKADGYYSYLYDNENGLGEFSLWISDQQGQIVTSHIQQNFIGDFMLGGMRNRIVAGLDYFNRNIIDNSTGYAWVHNVTPQGEVNYVNPYTGVEVEPNYLTRTSIDNLLASAGMSQSNSKDAAYGAYVSDILNLTPSLLVMASLRFDYFDTDGDITTEDDDYDQTALSPKFGLLYQILPDRLSLFVNYMNGFKNVGPQTVADPDGQNPRIKTFEPEHANQVEVGIKTNLFSERLNATLSYYDINVSNLVTGDPENVNNSLQGGEVVSKGFEVDIHARPVDGLSLILGYSHNESEVVEGDEGNIWLETGRRPIYSGPGDLLNAWATYSFGIGPLRGVGFGVGANYVSELNILDSQITGTFTLPSYTVFNATLFYNATRFRAAINVNNLTDKQYYTGYSTINPQKPRNAVVSLAYKF
ncbi:MAG TPA: TonB-dependent receptor [Cyclobacteriaceae bacterium]